MFLEGCFDFGSVSWREIMARYVSGMTFANGKCHRGGRSDNLHFHAAALLVRGCAATLRYNAQVKHKKSAQGAC